jgi:hypothetical protein
MPSLRSCAVDASRPRVVGEAHPTDQIAGFDRTLIALENLQAFSIVHS